MRIEDLMKLVNAGFTKDEIKAIAGTSETDPEPAPAPAPAPEPAPDPKSVEPIKQEDIQQAQETGNAIDALTQQVANLTALVQKSNLLRMEQPDVKPETAEDVIASIIFPTYKGDNK